MENMEWLTDLSISGRNNEMLIKLGDGIFEMDLYIKKKKLNFYII